jgi:hypothetical protein
VFEKGHLISLNLTKLQVFKVHSLIHVHIAAYSMAQNQAQRNPSSATQTKEAQLKVYQKRLRDDIKSMTDNFLEIIRLMKV